MDKLRKANIYIDENRIPREKMCIRDSHRTWKKCHRVSCWTEGDDRAAGILWTLLSMPSWKV